MRFRRDMYIRWCVKAGLCFGLECVTWKWDSRTKERVQCLYSMRLEKNRKHCLQHGVARKFEEGLLCFVTNAERAGKEADPRSPLFPFVPFLAFTYRSRKFIQRFSVSLSLPRETAVSLHEFLTIWWSQWSLWAESYKCLYLRTSATRCFCSSSGPVRVARKACLPKLHNLAVLMYQA